jgi:hypothetical protein
LQIRFIPAVVAAVALALVVPLSADNVIQRENARPGDADWVLRNEAVNHEIEGYASATSINRGESISFFVSTVDPSYTITIYRLGWYGGDGGRKLFGPVTRTGGTQPTPAPDTLGKIECAWTNPYVLAVPNSADPTDWPSGNYVAKLIGSSGKQKFIPFVVRDDARSANHYFNSSVNTAQAYNDWGGRSLYSSPVQGRKVSFNRPYTGGGGTGDFLWNWEYNFVRFLEREGYDVQYCTDVDLARRGALIKNHKSLLIVGHPEYWTYDMRANVTAARDAGVNLGFFSGNSVYWQVRYEPSPVTGDADRVVVGYKEAASQDPYATDKDASNDKYVTTNWRGAPVNMPEAPLVGVQWKVQSSFFRVDGDIVIDNVTGAPWVFANTGLTKGSKLIGLLGYEVDTMTSASPSGTVRLGHSPYTDPNSGTVSNYDMTVYTAASGATVFATGSIQWAWGLDDWNNAQIGYRVSPAAQQMTRNILAKFAGSAATNDCQYVVSPAFVTTSASASSGAISVTTTSNCSWSAASNAPWLTLSPPTSGNGNGAVTFSVAQNGGAARSSTITLADKTVIVTQNSCSYSISPVASSQTSSGGSVTVNVTADAGCSWSAAGNSSWLSVGTTSGSGNGSVNVGVASNPGPARNGTATIAGQTFSVDQASGCVYSIAPSSGSADFPGGDGSFTISSSFATCNWNAVPSQSWLTITGAASGSGNGTIHYHVAANNAPSRTATIAVGGQTFSLTQAGGCTYTVDGSNTAVAASGGSAIVGVHNNGGCSWAAESHESWITVTGGTSGRGDGTVTFAVAQNTSGQSRIGWLSIAGRRYSVTQPATGAPANFAASMLSTTQTHLTWDTVAGAAQYEIARSANGGFFLVVAYATTNSYTDSGLTAGTTYVYQVRAVDGSGTRSPFSNNDIATLITFTDDPVIAGVTRIKAQHLAELRQAVNAVRAAAGLSARTWTDPAASGVLIKAVHIEELRDALDEARDGLALGAAFYSDVPVLEGFTPIRAAHVNEIRAAVK